MFSKEGRQKQLINKQANCGKATPKKKKFQKKERKKISIREIYDVTIWLRVGYFRSGDAETG